MKNPRSTIFVLIVLSGITLLQGVGEAWEAPGLSRHLGRSECCSSAEDLKLRPAGAGDLNGERPEETICDLCPSCLDVDIADLMTISSSSLAGEVVLTQDALPLLAGHTLTLLKPPQH